MPWRPLCLSLPFLGLALWLTTAAANAQALGVYPPEAIVKIGDTIPDIDEGLNAGAWTIGPSKWERSEDWG